MQSCDISTDFDNSRPKDIFIFMDGTGDGPSKDTNVYRLFQLVNAYKNPQTRCAYFTGVGVEIGGDENLIAEALGHGMVPRIIAAYDFLARTWNREDRVFVFGFSRGALEARSIAGLIAYAGIPKLSIDDDHTRRKALERIVRVEQKQKDEEYLNQWKQWTPTSEPPLLAKLESTLGGQLTLQTAEVSFLGVWDTVPGSAIKKFGLCKEQLGIFKRWIERSGERYKTDSYPPIRQIAHAMSLDEKRNGYSPLRTCPSISLQFTKREEVAFPGAHSDVGGGYDDFKVDGVTYRAAALPRLSLNWMVKRLQKDGRYAFREIPPIFDANPNGLAHASYLVERTNPWRRCVDRNLPNDIQRDESVGARAREGSVPIQVPSNTLELDVVLKFPYPADCSILEAGIKPRRSWFQRILMLF